MTNAVAKREDTQVSESAALIQVIERAAANPAVDIDKMERLLQMQERIMDRNAKMAYVSALAEMQADLPVIPERGKIQIGSGKAQMYALWEDINERIVPVLQKHGFALTFRTGREGERLLVTGVLSHKEGHSEETTISLPADISGSKNAVQAVGSSTSYGKRYTAQALLNLTSKGEDDDGVAANAAVRKQPKEPVIGKLNKTKLKDEARSFAAAVEQCETVDDLVTLQSSNKTLLDQIRVDMPSWWDGSEDFDGLAARIATKHDELLRRT